MKKKIAREYFLLLVGLTITVIAFVSLVLSSKYYEGLSIDHNNSLIKTEEELRNFNHIHNLMSSCYYDIGTKEKLARDFLKLEVIENIFTSLNDRYSNGNLRSCEIELRDYLIEVYRTPWNMHLAFNYNNKSILEHKEIERQKLDGLKDKIIPYDAEAFRNTIGFRVFRVNRNMEGLSSRERNDIDYYLEDFRRHNGEYDLFQVPLVDVEEFAAEVSIVEEVKIEVPFGKTILSKTAIVAVTYFLLFFLLRYFYYTIVWSIKTMKSE